MCQACAKAAEMPWSLVVKTTGPRTSRPGFQSRLFMSQQGGPYLFVPRFQVEIEQYQSYRVVVLMK